MSQEDKNRASIEAEQLPKLLDGQKLFGELLKDKSLFPNLEYTEYQAALANRVLSNIDRQANVERLGDEFYFLIEGDNAAWSIEIGQLRHGGYYLTGMHDYQADEMRYAQTLEERLLISFSKKATQPIYSDYDEDFVAHLRILPIDIADKPKEDLVRALYEGTEGAGKLVTMHERDDYMALSSEDFSVAFYQASWVPGITNQDLVVATDYTGKANDLDDEVRMEVWRRLPDISFNDKLWTPFGMLPSKVADKLTH